MSLPGPSTWHDGEPLTSADVKYTYELFAEQEAYMYATYLLGISDIQCPDDYTVVMTTDEPKANMLMNTTPIVPKHIWEAQEDPYNWTNPTPIGSGPFKYDSEGEAYLKLTKNENYFNGMAHIDNLVFVVHENSDTAAQALLLGEIDGTTGLAPAQIEQLEGEEGVEVVMAEVPGFSEIAINVWPDGEGSEGNPLLRDKTIRHAIEYCVDKERIVSMVYGNAGSVGTTLINPGDDFHYEPTAAELRTYDTAKAAALLEEAGYKDANGDGIREDAAGNPLSFELIAISDNTTEIKTAQMVAGGCAEAGIEIKVTTMDSGALTDLIYTPDFDLFIWGWGADIDPSVILKLFTTEELMNLNESGFSDERYDELFYLQQNEMDKDARIALVQEMQQIAYDSAHYIIYIYDNYIQGIRSDKWTGYTQTAGQNGGVFQNFTYLTYMNLAPVE